MWAVNGNAPWITVTEKTVTEDCKLERRRRGISMASSYFKYRLTLLAWK